IAEAAANPGNTSARNDQRQQARRFLLPEGPGIVFGPTDLTGDVVVGGKTVNYQGVAGRGPRSYPLDAERLAEVRGVFVPPPGYPALVEYCLTHRIVVLRGPHGWGKTTTAISLLDDVACHTLVLLESTADLRRLTAERIATGVGYLLTDIATGQLGEL